MTDPTEPGIPGPPAAADEATTVRGALERQRATFAWKVAGLDAAGLTARLGVSGVTLGGLLKHLAFVEDFKFGTMLRGKDLPSPWDTVDWEETPDYPWSSAAADAPETLYALWHDAVARSRESIGEALATEGLDTRIVYGYGDDPEQALSLRRLIADLIEEYARHNGHADLIREAIDGSVGEDPPGPVYPYEAP
jgi:hypothetical protein